MPTTLHPLFVHFPIALLLSSVALQWAGRFWPGKGLDQAAWYTLLLGMAGTVVTLATGLVAAQGVAADSAATGTLSLHRLLGIATFMIFGVLAIWHWRSKGNIDGSRRVFYTVLQIAGVLLLVAAGFYGGELVYTYGVGVAVAP